MCLSYWDKNWSFGWFSSYVTELGYGITDHDSVKLHFFVLEEVNYDLRCTSDGSVLLGVMVYFYDTLTLGRLYVRSRACHHLKWGGHLCYAFFCNRWPWVMPSSSELQWHQHERWCLCCCLQLGKGDKPFPGKELPWRFVTAYDLLPLKK